mgnify:CR=1 FL=1
MFKKHYQEWCLLSYSYLGNNFEAEDIVQDIFVTLLLKDNVEEILNLKNYIGISVRNASLKRIGRLKKLVKLDQTSLFIPSQEDPVMDMQTKLKIQTAILALPDQSKKILELCVLDGLKYESAANAMGISVNTIKYHLKKSFKTLRYTLRNTYFSILVLTFLLLHHFA